MIKNYKDLLCEESNDESVNISKQEVEELLNDLAETVDSPTEAELTNLLLSMVKMDIIDERGYDALFDAIEEIIEIEENDQEEIGVEKKQECDDCAISEKMKPLYKKGNKYVRCPNGKIRLRGHCGKPVDKKKSRTAMKAHKKNKASYKRGLRKTKKTKKRLGQIKR